MRLLVCGNRDWTCKETIAAWLERFRTQPNMVLIHGGSFGADVIAEKLVFDRGLNWPSIAYKARWKDLGKAAGPARNEYMLTHGKPDRCLAFGLLFRGSKLTGTGDMVSRCNDAGIIVTIVPRPMVLP